MSYHKQQSTNKKGICKTLADRVHQLNFIDVYMSKQKCPHFSSSSIWPAQDFSSLNQTCSAYALVANSEGKAIDMLHYVQNCSDMPNNVKKQSDFGIMVGKGKSLNITTLDGSAMNDVLYWMNTLGTSSQAMHAISELAESFNCLLKENEDGLAVVYRQGDMIMLQDHSCSNKEWVVKVGKIFQVGPIYDQFYSFITADWYVATANRDGWTEQAKLSLTTYASGNIQPTKYIKHKVMLWTCPEAVHSVLCIDPDTYIDYNRVVSFPPCPKVHDYIQFRQLDDSIGMLKVTEVNKKQVKGIELTRTANPRKWKKSQHHVVTEHKFVLAIVPCTHSQQGRSVTITLPNN